MLVLPSIEGVDQEIDVHTLEGHAVTQEISLEGHALTQEIDVLTLEAAIDPEVVSQEVDATAATTLVQKV